MEQLLTSLPVKEVGAVGSLVAIYFILLATTKLIKVVRNGKEMHSVTGLSFEERMAFIEDKTLKLETNHIEHVRADIARLEKRFDDLNETCTYHFYKLSERVAVMETRMPTK